MILLLQAGCCCFQTSPVFAATYEPSSIVPPKPAREFRGAWIATVGNRDWPSKPGLSTAEQKAELLAILDRAAQLKLNAVILQVRPACDALYASSIDPWSEYLTGTMGHAPEPFYDPLSFAVAEAHKRGLELHAWFNPYRARYSKSISPVSSSHVSRAQPQLVKKYGNFLWLDPGEPEVADYTLSVVMDVVKRYDIDGVHFDDYFYPDKKDSGTDEDFPDGPSWRRLGAGRGMSRDDWRRENVNEFIQRVYRSIKSAKPWVKFGISPFGIWRPGNPAQIVGKDAYADLKADSRKWLANGWVDYFAPQLYWAEEPKAQSFSALLQWWADQNAKGRHLWPGMNTANVGGKWKADEIVRQIQITRRQPGATGHIHWNMHTLMTSPSLDSALEHTVYTQPALVPASSWLSGSIPEKPIASVSGDGSEGNLRLSWRGSGTNSSWLWVVQLKSQGEWTTEIVPVRAASLLLTGPQPDAVAVTAIDRCGNSGAPCVLEKRTETAGKAGSSSGSRARPRPKS